MNGFERETEISIFSKITLCESASQKDFQFRVKKQPLQLFSKKMCAKLVDLSKTDQFVII